MRKLTRTEVTSFKQGLFRKQGGICPLCLEELPTKLSSCALDHDHITGEVRGLLHLGCNKVEGSVLHAVATWGGQGKDYKKAVPFIERLVQYIKESGEGVIYHLHKTPEEVAEATRKRNNARARAKRRLKKES